MSLLDSPINVYTCCNIILMSHIHETEMLLIVRQINSEVYIAPCLLHISMSFIWDRQLKRPLSSYIPEYVKHHQLTHLENYHTKLSQTYLKFKTLFQLAPFH